MNKTISAALLVMLLFIHSIKLIHTHSSFSSHDVHQHGLITNTNTDCSICDYQLSKDADGAAYVLFDISKPELNNTGTQLILSYTYFFHTAFENRGPPTIDLLKGYVMI